MPYQGGEDGGDDDDEYALYFGGEEDEQSQSPADQALEVALKDKAARKQAFNQQRLKWWKELKQLEGMGFVDTHTNLTFLEQYAGDIARVVFMISHGTLQLRGFGGDAGEDSQSSVQNTKLITTEITEEAAARGAVAAAAVPGEIVKANGRKLWPPPSSQSFSLDPHAESQWDQEAYAKSLLDSPDPSGTKTSGGSGRSCAEDRLAGDDDGDSRRGSVVLFSV
jgi:hypothetical protein